MVHIASIDLRPDNLASRRARVGLTVFPPDLEETGCAGAQPKRGQPDDGGNDVFVHISAVERAGMYGLNDGQKVAFEIVAYRKTGKSSAENLRAL
jgi:cold shock protein